MGASWWRTSCSWEHKLTSLCAKHSKWRNVESSVTIRCFSWLFCFPYCSSKDWLLLACFHCSYCFSQSYQWSSSSTCQLSLCKWVLKKPMKSMISISRPKIASISISILSWYQSFVMPWWHSLKAISRFSIYTPKQTSLRISSWSLWSASFALQCWLPQLLDTLDT